MPAPWARLPGHKCGSDQEDWAEGKKQVAAAVQAPLWRALHLGCTLVWSRQQNGL